MACVGHAFPPALTGASLGEHRSRAPVASGSTPPGRSGGADAPPPVHASHGGRRHYSVMASCTPKTTALLMALLPLGRMMYCRSGVTESQRVTVIW